MNKFQKKIETYIDEHQQEAIILLQRMVQQPSLQGNEKGVQTIVIDKLKQLKLVVDCWDPDHADLVRHPYFVESRKSYSGSPNVVGVWKGKGGGKSVLLNGHVDVVPEGDRTKWSHDPFSGHVENGKMFGRGTTDMKGGNLALLLALESIVNSGIQLKGDVIFESVIEEETGGVGTLAAVMRGYKADAAIVPEPTNMKLFIKQQGSMWFRITVEGRSAHGGTRYEGVSAIEKAWKIFNAIMQLESKRNAVMKDPLYKGIPIPLPINIGKIQGGSWPSSVADLVTFEGRIGVGPEEEIQDVKTQLRECINNASANDEWLKEHPARLEFFGGQWIPNAIDASHPFVNLIKEKFEQVYKKPIKIEASPWGTDGGILGKAGNTPTIVIGPGETKMAHYPNEFIDLNEVILAAKLFATMILDWCEVSEA